MLSNDKNRASWLPQYNHFNPKLSKTKIFCIAFTDDFTNNHSFKDHCVYQAYFEKNNKNETKRKMHKNNYATKEGNNEN